MNPWVKQCHSPHLEAHYVESCFPGLPSLESDEVCIMKPHRDTKAEDTHAVVYLEGNPQSKIQTQAKVKYQQESP